MAAHPAEVKAPDVNRDSLVLLRHNISSRSSTNLIIYASSNNRIGSAAASSCLPQQPIGSLDSLVRSVDISQRHQSVPAAAAAASGNRVVWMQSTLGSYCDSGGVLLRMFCTMDCALCRHVLCLLAVFVGLAAAGCKRNYESDDEEEMPMSKCQADAPHCQMVTDTQVFEVIVSNGRLHALYIRHNVRVSFSFNFSQLIRLNLGRVINWFCFGQISYNLFNS